MNKQDLNQLQKFLDDIFSTEINEIQCDQAGSMMAKSTHDGLSETESQRQYPLLWRHFQFCPDCAEEYRMLDELTELERSGRLNQPFHIPVVPDSKKTSFLNQIKEIFSIEFPGFQRDTVLAIQRGSGSLQMEPVEIVLGGEYTVQFDVTADEEDTSYRHLFGTLLTEDVDIMTASEGCSVWLQLDDNVILQEEVIEELGDFSFSHIKPGDYLIRLLLPDKEYVISGISVP
jgi:hypothetical protein